MPLGTVEMADGMIETGMYLCGHHRRIVRYYAGIITDYAAEFVLTVDGDACQAYTYTRKVQIYFKVV